MSPHTVGSYALRNWPDSKAYCFKHMEHKAEKVIRHIDLTGTDVCHQYVFRWKHAFDPQLYKAHESLLMDADVFLSMWRFSMLDIKEPMDSLQPEREKDGGPQELLWFENIILSIFTCLFIYFLYRKYIHIS